MYQVRFARIDENGGELFNVVDEHGAVCRSDIGLAYARKLADQFAAQDAEWAAYYAAVAKTDGKAPQ